MSLKAKLRCHTELEILGAVCNNALGCGVPFAVFMCYIMAVDNLTIVVKVQEDEFGIPAGAVVPVHAISGFGSAIILFFCLKISGCIRASSVELLRDVRNELNRRTMKTKGIVARSKCLRRPLEIKLGHFATAEIGHGFEFIQQIVDGIVMAIFMVNVRYPSWILGNM